MNFKSSKLTLCGLFMLLFLLSGAIEAQNKVIVIPMAGEDLKPLANIVTVALENGDFDDPVLAMESIEDASEDKPYLLVIAPGIYQLEDRQLQMKEYVDIAGSGQNVTILRGSVSSASYDETAALVVAQRNGWIRDLTIENTDGEFRAAMGIYNDTSGVVISNVTILVSDATETVGIQNSSASVTIRDSKVTVKDAALQTGITIASSSSATILNTSIVVASSSNSQVGVRVNASTAKILNSEVIVVKGGQQTGVRITASSPIVSDSTINIYGGNQSRAQYGIFSSTGILPAPASLPTISDTTISVTEGSTQYGVFGFSTSSAIVRSSTISAATNSIRGSTTAEAQDMLVIGSILSSSVSGDPICAASFMPDGTALDNSCEAPL